MSVIPMSKTKYMLRVEMELGRDLAEYLQEEYHVNRKTILEISEIIGVKNSTLKKWFSKLGIPTRDLSEAALLRYEGTSFEYRQRITKDARNVVRERIEEGSFWLKPQFGEDSPAKRPEVKRANSLRMKKNNPMFVEEYAMKMRKSMERVLRDRATRHELLFKNAIEKKGYFPKFQHAEYKAILDFAFVDEKIGIEIDGDPHLLIETTRKRDEVRDAALRDRGWEIIRIPNKLIDSDIEGVVNDVIRFVESSYVLGERWL